jgi:ribosome biogenesis GTPase A
LFLEVRDAWLPISSKNTELEKILIKRNKIKNRLIIFNKFDLCNKTKTSAIIDNYNKIGINCLNVSVK